MELTVNISHPDAAELIRALLADPNPAEVIALGLANIAEWRGEQDEEVS